MFYFKIFPQGVFKIKQEGGDKQKREKKKTITVCQPRNRPAQTTTHLLLWRNTRGQGSHTVRVLKKRKTDKDDKPQHPLHTNTVKHKINVKPKCRYLPCYFFTTFHLPSSQFFLLRKQQKHTKKKKVITAILCTNHPPIPGYTSSSGWLVDFWNHGKCSH